MKKEVLLCPPKYFFPQGISYEINPWMRVGTQVNLDRAWEQWLNLERVYEQLGVRVHKLSPQPGLPDMVFTANGFFTLNGKALIANFRCFQRQEESKYHAHWLQSRGFEIYRSDCFYEGQGDTFSVGETIYLGFGFRSDERSEHFLQKIFPDHEVVVLRLVDPHFYHLDTCFFPINSRLCFIWEKAFDSQSLKFLKQKFSQVISISEEEAISFALNSVVIDECVVTGSFIPSFKQKLKALGLEVIQLEMDEFFKSGGSVKCCSNELFI